ncbi:hypothetical protein [Actinacidiphila oryziradicis]|uniref:Uncharacterized protein n=1 Tax=Actinacidiphila oryziradicis TaxID=2571141 RepID=A0A4U0RX42_9ACTN|nr:hypothetical protein [Actinacidiphila oryziradicis]TKA00850.1 hypothetical protein FCI23_41865 [Actinacidiphila oryziradicis]
MLVRAGLSDGVLVKEERTYKRLVEVLGMARHCGRIPCEALRDDTAISAEPAAYDDGPGHFPTTLLAAARDFRLDRRTGQQVRLDWPRWGERAINRPRKGLRWRATAPAVARIDLVWRLFSPWTITDPRS